MMDVKDFNLTMEVIKEKVDWWIWFWKDLHFLFQFNDFF
jgi:hypothetical protein